MKEIPLTQNKVAIIDDDDLELISQYKWFAVNNNGRGFYAVSSMKGKARIRMHRLIMGVTDQITFVDHRNHNGLDNRKNNLRICSQQENQRNRQSNKSSTSKFVGVSKVVNKKNGKQYPYWMAQIKHLGKSKCLGVFPFTSDGEIEAARRRDAEALILHGEFANLNFPNPPQQ